MPEVLVSQLQQAFRGLHDCESSLVEKVRVEEDFQGQRVWQGDVWIFSLQGHPTAGRCYAWSEPVGDSEKRRFIAVLHEPPVDSPAAAVRASIVAREKDRGDSNS